MFGKRVSLFLVILFLFSFLSLVPTTVSANECKITLLHFNDLHGYLNPPDKKLGGAERLAGLISKIEMESEKASRQTLLLIGGDLISGTPVSEQFKGEAEYKFLGLIGTEAMVIGNHDFDFGWEALNKNIKGAGFPVLAANILNKKTRQTIAPATYVFPLGPGCRVGVMGLTRADTPQVSASDLSSLEFDDPLKYAEYYIDDLLEQSEVRVALTHLGAQQDMDLVKRVPGLHVVLGGGDHVSKEDYCKEVKGVPICQTPAKGTYLGRVDISVQGGKVVIEKTELIPVDKKSGKLKEMKELLNQYFSKVESSMGEVVGAIDKALDYMPKEGTVSPSPLGEFVAEAIKVKSGADLAFINMGCLRKTLVKGDVTRGDIFEAIPFSDYVGVIDLTGDEILKLIAMSEEKARPDRPQPFFCWSGLKYGRTDGSYRVDLTGKSFSKQASYKVATIDFLAKGGDGYDLLKSKKFNNTGKLVRNIVAEYLQKK